MVQLVFSKVFGVKFPACFCCNTIFILYSSFFLSFFTADDVITHLMSLTNENGSASYINAVFADVRVYYENVDKCYCLWDSPVIVIEQHNTVEAVYITEKPFIWR